MSKTTKKQYSVFDIIGPIMVGPSSSHTAGAARLGFMAGYLCGETIKNAQFFMHGSFAKTYTGHGTDKALLAGIMGIPQDDSRLKRAFEIAKEKGIAYQFESIDLGEYCDNQAIHPNTVKIVLTTVTDKLFTLIGSSIGGGNIYIMEINGVSVNFNGEAPILAMVLRDEPGVVAGITAMLYRYRINIGNMQVSRREKKEACMYMELFLEGEKEVPETLEKELMAQAGIKQVILLEQSKLSAYEEKRYV